MVKRQRTTGGFRVAVRPIDKRIINVLLTGVAAANQTTVLATTTSACTIVGLRWSFFVEGDAGTERLAHDYRWAIVKVDDGENPTALDSTDAGTFYSPEQQVMAWGTGTSRADAAGATNSGGMKSTWNGKSKAMRKLRAGDRILFVIRGVATETVRCSDAVQLFCKQ